jgi:hypothetical protein
MSLKTDVNLDFLNIFHHINKTKNILIGDIHNTLLWRIVSNHLFLTLLKYMNLSFSVFETMNPFIKRTGV